VQFPTTSPIQKLIQFNEREVMKEMLENLSVALGHKGEINKATQQAAENMMAFGMNYIEINAYALSCIESENFGKY
jgi:hypothetical protein